MGRHSFEKLQIYLNKLGYVIIKIYTEKECCLYIELFSKKTSDLFLVYIPSNFEFKMTEGGNVYKVKLIRDVDATEDNGELVYNGKIHLDPTKQDDMDEHLNNQYKHDISLKDIAKNDLLEIKSIYKQLKRLKYCIQNINYKIGIVYKNYLCVIRRQGTIECFIVKQHPKSDTKKLYILTDLDQIYKNSDQLEHDVKVVQTQLYKLLEQNQSLHSRVIDTIMENKSDVIAISEKMKETRNLYERRTTRLQKMLDNLIKVEEFKFDEIKRLSHNSPYSNIADDLGNANLRGTLEADLHEINNIKMDISRYLNMIKDKREDILLSCDDILYDNTLMFDTMLGNFTKLKKYTEAHE